jgi:hypothetical protein
MALPAIAHEEEQLENELSNIPQFTFLTNKQKAVLFVMINPDNFSLSDSKIADLAGADRGTVYNCKNSTNFLQCLSDLTKRYAKSQIPQVIKVLTDKAREGNNKAIELLVKYTGDYIPTQRNENLNANLESGIVNPLEALDKFLISMGKAGVTADFILNRFIELKNQNAF